MSSFSPTHSLRESQVFSSRRACVHAQSCLILWNPMDCSLLGIFQARILKWVTTSIPGTLPYPGILSESPALAGRFFNTEPPRKPIFLQEAFHNPICRFSLVFPPPHNSELALTPLYCHYLSHPLRPWAPWECVLCLLYLTEPILCCE